MFESTWTSVVDGNRYRHPSTSRNEQNMILENCRVISARLGINVAHPWCKPLVYNHLYATLTQHKWTTTEPHSNGWSIILKHWPKLNMTDKFSKNILDMEVKLHTFYTLALGWCKSSDSWSSCFIPEERAPVPTGQETGWDLEPFWMHRRRGNSLTLLWSKPRQYSPWPVYWLHWTSTPNLIKILSVKGEFVHAYQNEVRTEGNISDMMHFNKTGNVIRIKSFKRL
jgi:hypothetical protein